MRDRGRAREDASVEGAYAATDAAQWRVRAVMEGWTDEQTAYAARRLGRAPQGGDFAALGIRPVTVLTTDGNLLVTVGLAQLTSRLISAEQVWDNTHVGLGIGSSTTTANISQQDLQGASKHYQVMDTSPISYPTASNGVLTFRATWGPSDGNFSWQEWGIVVANTATAFSAGATKPTDYVLLNRKVADYGTKSGGTLGFLVTVTIE